MIKALLISLLSLLISCKTDNHAPCDLEYLNGFSYLGNVNYCNAMAGQQVFFDGRATLEVLDSAFIVSIVSIDTIMANFHFIDTALVQCLFGETDYYYQLYPLSGQGEDLGFLSTGGNTLAWKIFLDPCFDSTFFSGFLE